MSTIAQVAARNVFIALAAILVISCAPQHAAIRGQAADSATTVIGLAAGMGEANPVIAAAPALLLVKPFIPMAVRSASQYFETCVAGVAAADVIGYAAAGWNLGLLAGGPPAGAVAAGGAALVRGKHATSSAALYCWSLPMRQQSGVVQL